MSGKLKIGIIGCGGIANNKHMPSLAKLEDVEMVAFCDIIIEKAEKAAKKFGIKEAKVYDDYKKLLEDSNIDVIHVCTPNSSHCLITTDALKAEKHVMCEKPMAISSKEARKMVDVAKETGKKLSIGYQNRYTPEAVYLKRACENDDLGEIYFAKAHAIRRRAVPTWGVFLDEEQQGGGPLIDIGTHALDLTLYMMDNYKPKMVVGKAYYKLKNQTETANAWGDWDPKEYTVEDSAFGYITMENGSTIFLESSWALNTLEVGEAQTTLCGTKAGADMKDGLRINGVKYNKQYVEKPALNAEGVDFYDGENDTPALIEARQWIDCIINDTEPVVKPEQAFVVTQILEAIYKSSQTGKPVYLNEEN